MPFVNKELLSHFNTQSQDNLSLAAQELLKSMAVEVKVKGEVPLTGPLLVISNHPGALDTMMVFSTVDREDFYFVALASYAQLGTEVENRLLPIYRKRKLRDKLIDVFIKGLQVHVVDDEEVTRTRNRQSIGRAAEIVNQGGAVIIFPTGTGGRTSQIGQWKAGVGHLVKQITNPETQIVFAHIDGGTKTDFLRYLEPWIVSLLFSPKTMELEYSQPKVLRGGVDTGLSGREITSQLEMQYKEVFGMTR